MGKIQIQTRDEKSRQADLKLRKSAAASHRFWNFSEEENERVLRIDGIIAEESWLDDDVTPKQFKAELEESDGDITLWLNSPGGCVFAASQIYNMLRDYTGKVTVKVDGIAASAASVVAMAGDEILMSPVSLMMIHDPMTVAIGDTEEMQKAISMLGEIKEAIINAYQTKSGLTPTADDRAIPLVIQMPETFSMATSRNEPVFIRTDRYQGLSGISNGKASGDNVSLYLKLVPESNLLFLSSRYGNTNNPVTVNTEMTLGLGPNITSPALVWCNNVMVVL